MLGNEVECGRTMEHNIESSRRGLVNDQHLAYSQGKGRDKYFIIYLPFVL